MARAGAKDTRREKSSGHEGAQPRTSPGVVDATTGVTSAGPAFRVSDSPIHGRGVYATRAIRRGARIVEYVGERISHEEGARRYDDEATDFIHVLLFTVDDETVIDAAVGGNDARFINHSCAPNCEAVDRGGRIYIRALRSIRPDEELTYDYRLQREGDDRDEIARRYPCLCGAETCRGTLLADD